MVCMSCVIRWILYSTSKYLKSGSHTLSVLIWNNISVSQPNNCQCAEQTANLLGNYVFRSRIVCTMSVHGNSDRQKPTKRPSSEVCVDVIRRWWVCRTTASSWRVENEPIFAAIWLGYRDQFIYETTVDSHLAHASQLLTSCISPFQSNLTSKEVALLWLSQTI